MNKKNLSILMILMSIAMLIVGMFVPSGMVSMEVKAVSILLGVCVLTFGLLQMPTRKHKEIVQIIFLLPLVLTFLVTVIIPFAFGCFYSLTDWNGITYTQFLGLENYKTMFQSKDYLYSFSVTFLYSVINILLVNILAFALALLCSSKMKGRNFFRAAYFIPNLIGGIVLGYVWQFIFNKVFTTIFVGSQSILTKPNTAIMAIIIVSSWQYVGYIMMIYITGIQTIPEDIIEASNVDGANGLTSLIKIKIPMLASSFTICLFLTLINSFKQFDLNFAITNGAPSRIINGMSVPSTEFLALNIYRTAISKNNYALGQAKAVVFFVILAIIALLQVYISKKKEVEA